MEKKGSRMTVLKKCVGAAFATGGVASWLFPSTLPVLISGIGLISAKEQKEGV